MGKRQLILLTGLILLLLASAVVFSFKKEIKKQLITIRDRAAVAEYSDLKPAEELVWGIDISHHQQGIAWDKLENPSPDFVFLKATEGATHRDTRYGEYKARLKEKGIPAGAYHFFSYRSGGVAQAKNFLKTVGLRKGDLPPVLDAELTSGMPGKEKVQQELLIFIRYVEIKTGVKPIIYCERDYYNKYLKEKLKDDYPLWISDFWRRPACDFVFWQKTDKFKHPAFKGTIDYNVFNGSREELEKLRIN